MSSVLRRSSSCLRVFVFDCPLVFIAPPAPEASRRTNVIFSFGSYNKKLKRELCASRRNLSQQAGWTIVSDAVSLYGIVLL